MKSVPRYTFRISGTLSYTQLITHFTWLRIASLAVKPDVPLVRSQAFAEDTASRAYNADEFWKKGNYNFQLKFMVLSIVYGTNSLTFCWF